MELVMHNKITAYPYWTTASYGDAADTSPMELAALGAHLDLCRETNHRLFTLRCVAEATNGFISARFVTTLALVALVAGLVSIVW